MTTKPGEKNITLRLPRSLHTHLVLLAKREGRSLNAQIVHMLHEGTLAYARQHVGESIAAPKGNAE